MDRREFLLSTVVGGALCTMPSAIASPVFAGELTRISPSSVMLKWNGTSLPVSASVASDPDAAPDHMHALKSGLRGGNMEFPLAVSPRPYVLLRTADNRETRVAERLLPLAGGRNFRDAGGYRTEDGRQVRWGKIYRSGVMSSLTAADMDYLASLGIKVICDLRTTEERQAAPSPFLKSDATQVVATDYSMPPLDAMDHARNRADAVVAFAHLYVTLLDVLGPQFTDLFARLANREAPLAFNCSAGKDRTGVATALILSVLGVPRETIVADYALTQVYMPPSNYLKQIAAGLPIPGMSPKQVAALSRMPRAVQEVMMGSDPLVMRNALATIDSKFGGPVELATRRFGLNNEKIMVMRKTFLI